MQSLPSTHAGAPARALRAAQWAAVALLGGAVLALGAMVLERGQVFAQSSGGGPPIALGGNSQPGGRNMLWTISGQGDRTQLAIYEGQQRQLILHGSRNVSYDLQFDQFPGRAGAHRPTVQEAFRETEKARRDARTPK